MQAGNYSGAAPRPPPGRVPGRSRALRYNRHPRTDDAPLALPVPDAREALPPAAPLRASLPRGLRVRDPRDAAGRVDRRDDAAHRPAAAERHRVDHRRKRALGAADDRRRVRPARHRQLHQRIRPRVDRLPRRLRPALRGGGPPAAAAHAVLRRVLRGRFALEGDVRRAAGRGDRLRGDHGDDPQHADHRVHARLSALHQLAAHADRLRRVSARRVRDPEDQPADEARQRSRAGAHGYADPRAGRGDQRAPGRQGVRRREIRELPPARSGRPTASRDGEAGRGGGAGHADQPDHRVDRRRCDPLGGDPAKRRRELRRRRFRHLRLRAAAPHEPAEDADECHRHDPARPHCRRKRVRADRRDAGSRHRRRRRSTARPAASASSTSPSATGPIGRRRWPESTLRFLPANRSRWSVRQAAARRRSSI